MRSPGRRWTVSALYDIGRVITGCSSEVRRRVRQTRTRPLAENFNTWSEVQLGRVSGKSALAKSFRYAADPPSRSS
ncbi:transposase [Paracoccus sp. C2R09]|uniref:IS66 family transposase n=1 Tax=Paracoccus sp. 1_MG-2023 TaxID=3062651 RepID=UPI001C098D69|nr:transposase [Paracoccus sp. C2R09]